MKRLLVACIVLGVLVFSAAAQIGNTAALHATWPLGPGAPDQASCSQILTAVGTNLATRCNKLDKDQICLANAEVMPDYVDQGGSTQLPFAQVGDIAPIKTFKGITTTALNLDSSTWGVALLKAQATTATNAATGQTATFILYGNAAITNITSSTAPIGPLVVATQTPTPRPTCKATVARRTRIRAAPNTTGQVLTELTDGTALTVTDRSQDNQWVYGQYQDKMGWLFAANLNLACSLSDLPLFDPNRPQTTTSTTAPPLQLPALLTFTLSTTPDPQSQCTNLPPSSLFVESPDGSKVSFKVDGADISIGSRVLISAVPNGVLQITVIAGLVTVTANGSQVQVPGGTQVTIPLGGANGLTVTGPPGAPQLISDVQTFAQTALPAICGMAASSGLSTTCTLVLPNLSTPTPTVRAPVTNQPGS